MTRALSKMLVTAAAALMAVSACGRDEPAMSPAARIAPAHSPDVAVDAIANARCDREQRCNNIGATADYQNREHCMNVARDDAAEELTEDEDCRRGIKPEDLNECLSNLRGQSCGAVGGAFDRLGANISCRSAELCMD